MSDPLCPECNRPLARVAGAGAHQGWTCVNCNAAGDPALDYLDDEVRADPDADRPCSCEESERLRETIARMRREWFSPEYGVRAAERLRKAEARVAELEDELSGERTSRIEMNNAALRAEARVVELHLVTDAERQRMVTDQLAAVRTRAEKAVLDDMAKVPTAELHRWRVGGTVWASNAAVSELARRGEKA